MKHIRDKSEETIYYKYLGGMTEHGSSLWSSEEANLLDQSTKKIKRKEQGFIGGSRRLISYNKGFLDLEKKEDEGALSSRQSYKNMLLGVEYDSNSNLEGNKDGDDVDFDWSRDDADGMDRDNSNIEDLNHQIKIIEAAIKGKLDCPILVIPEEEE